MSDHAVRGTNDDAIVSRLSAASHGYFNDQYCKHFVKRPTRRSPIINRGTYQRFTGLNRLLDAFLALGGGSKWEKKQIVSLGAGSDTRYFALKEENRQPTAYFEVDFPEITTKKAMTIRKNASLNKLLAENVLVEGGTGIKSSDYHLIAADLRQMDTVVSKLLDYGFDKTVPTLFLSECVLIYLDPTVSDLILRRCCELSNYSVFLTYEQILPNDPFGTVMIRNLKFRNIELPGIFACPTLEDQKSRYLRQGWSASFAVDMLQLYEKHVTPAEKTRVSKLEIFDELEEWRMLSQHYCISWGIHASEGVKDGTSFVEEATIAVQFD
ncbi:S-adenosyl-L-methionine-dependent methyltransferase [Cladochytrium replicatum]|nr:S-adenosyl-L-methionine-dependent methyltransferase [Cladochytrium replicatum]